MAHPNATGNSIVGGYWADAIRSNLEYQIMPDHEWLAADDSFTLGEGGTLTHTIDKYFGEFVDVAVDGQTLTSSDYTATAGSTVIELGNAFLNSLAVGNHTLSVGFYGGVNVSSQFTILAANNGGGNNGGNNSGGNNSNGSGSIDTPFSPSVPNTGVGLMHEVGVMVAGLITVIAAIGVTLVGRRLLKGIK
jgi:hypothetical protein